MDASTVNIILGIAGIVVTLVGGGIGIRKLWRQPRLYYESSMFDLVQLADEDRKELAEEVLEREGLPTSMCRVDWWNAGRGTASDVTIDVQTPGKIIDWSIEPDTDDVRGPWEVSKDPIDGQEENANNHIRIEQDNLKARSRFSLSAGFHYDDEEDLGTVRCYADGRRIERYFSASRVHFLRMLPMILLILIGVATLVYVGLDARPEWGARELVGILALLVGMSFIASLVGRWGIPKWFNFVRRRERLEESDSTSLM